MKLKIWVKLQEAQNSLSSNTFYKTNTVNTDCLLEMTKLRKSSKNSCNDLVRLIHRTQIFLMSHSSLNFMMDIFRVWKWPGWSNNPFQWDTLVEQTALGEGYKDTCKTFRPALKKGPFTHLRSISFWAYYPVMTIHSYQVNIIVSACIVIMICTI